MQSFWNNNLKIKRQWKFFVVVLFHQWGYAYTYGEIKMLVPGREYLSLSLFITFVISTCRQVFSDVFTLSSAWPNLNSRTVFGGEREGKQLDKFTSRKRERETTEFEASSLGRSFLKEETPCLILVLPTYLSSSFPFSRLVRICSRLWLTLARLFAAVGK